MATEQQERAPQTYEDVVAATTAAMQTIVAEFRATCALSREKVRWAVEVERGSVAEIDALFATMAWERDQEQFPEIWPPLGMEETLYVEPDPVPAMTESLTEVVDWLDQREHPQHLSSAELARLQQAAEQGCVSPTTWGEIATTLAAIPRAVGQAHQRHERQVIGHEREGMGYGD